MIAVAACGTIGIAIALFLGGGLGVFLGRSTQQSTTSTSANSPQNLPPSQPTSTKSTVSLQPAENWQANNHVHGLAVNPTNPKIFYVATHNGLLQRSESGQWFWMGKQRADYMGFTADPTNENRFYSSGHPPTGGNLGFQISDNRGEDWQQISLPGVDFHALTIAPSNPNVFYGFPASGAEGIHRSTDGGKTWVKTQMKGLEAAPFGLHVDPRNADHVFATTRAGLYESRDRGETWSAIASTQNAPVVGLALLNSDNNTVMIGYRVLQSNSGLYQSNDAGKTWEKLGTGTEGLILQLTISPSNSQIIYAVNENNLVFQSQNGGRSWTGLS
jgi:hypothetical protein